MTWLEILNRMLQLAQTTSGQAALEKLFVDHGLTQAKLDAAIEAEKPVMPVALVPCPP